MTAVATIEKTEKKGITALLSSEEAKSRIVPMLVGTGLTAEDYPRVMGEAYLAASENPEILQCTPASIIRAIARAVGWGLTIGETVHLVPFNQNVGTKEEPKWEKRLKAIQDYKGKIELIVNAGGARSIDAQVVYEKEEFDYVGGSRPEITHRMARRAADRGKMIGAYAIAHHGFNHVPTIKWMTIDEIDAIRKRNSKSWKEGECTPWWARKCAVHQLAKMLPKNARLAKVMRAIDEDEDFDLPVGEPVAVVAAPAGEE